MVSLLSVWLLVGLDKEYAQAQPADAWPDWYAQRLLAHLG